MLWTIATRSTSAFERDGFKIDIAEREEASVSGSSDVRLAVRQHGVTAADVNAPHVQRGKHPLLRPPPVISVKDTRRGWNVQRGEIAASSSYLLSMAVPR